jgi:transcription antitermination factor NusG
MKFDLSGNERWFVAQTLARRETLALANLERQGFRAFLPRRLKTVRHARKISTTLAPVFPGYLFAILDLGRDRWRSINGSKGVASLIMGADRPQPVPEGVVETLAQSTGEGGGLVFDNLAPGQPVRLMAGPFADSHGVLDRLDGAGRVEILLQLMNSEVRTRVRRDWIEAAA